MLLSLAQMIHLRPHAALLSFALTLSWAWAGTAFAQPRQEISLSTVIDQALIADPVPVSPLMAPHAAGDGPLSVTGARFGPYTDQGARNFWVALDVKRPGAEARVLYVDPGLIFVAPDGASFVPVPHQRSLLILPEQTTNLELLPLCPEQALPPEGAPLKVVRSVDPGVQALMALVVQIEGEDTRRLKRYISERDGILEVDTIVDNRDVELAQWMKWDRSPDGRLRGRLSRDAIRFALYAVTGGYTIQEMTDWLRVHRKLQLTPGAESAWRVSRPVEYLLERAGLNYRVFSPRYADFHYNRGVKAYLAKDLDGAVAHFRAAVELKSDFVDAQYNMGVAYYRMGDLKKAQAAFLVASGMGQPDADVLYNRGATLFRLGDNLGAARAFRAALKLQPEDAALEAWLKKADPEGKTAPRKKKRRRRRRRRRR